MAITRGNRYDYDRWAELLNDPSWNYTNILQFFEKTENFTATNPNSPIDNNYHGHAGPLHVTQTFPPEQLISSIFMKGGQELGYNVTDYNAEQQEGVSVFQFNINNGWRHNFESAFLSPAKERQNLKVSDKSYVTKVVINNVTKTAEGVIFTRDNKTYIARARKEVILSAGVISSPHILLLSGIGPEEHLKSVGVPVINNLPVGQNLHDHTFTWLVFSTNATTGEEPLETSVRDLLKGQGSLTRPFMFDTVGWFSPLKKDSTQPEIEYIFLNISQATTMKRFMGYTDETFNDINVQVPGALALLLASLYTKSTGSIQLKSSDPFDYPLIDHNILSDEEDVEVVYQAIQLALNLTNTQTFRSINAKMALDNFPACNHTEPLSKEYWYCFIRITTGIGSHTVGTCSTGTSPETGVVDSKLKVFGVKGLRVADGSVIPFTVAGHTNAACAMVGERAADIIKNEYAN